MELKLTTICLSDYESFTESWFAADKNPGGRPAFVGLLRRPQQWDVPEMNDFCVCRP